MSRYGVVGQDGRSDSRRGRLRSEAIVGLTTHAPQPDRVNGPDGSVVPETPKQSGLAKPATARSKPATSVGFVALWASFSQSSARRSQIALSSCFKDRAAIC